jgi:2-polyprenyl-3-methyl-5-hydroxy-6-metoxy-1,4-benzoquinol methylase
VVFTNKPKTILLLDVIEHIEDDETFLKLCMSKLNKDGRIVITAPAFL